MSAGSVSTFASPLDVAGPTAKPGGEVVGGAPPIAGALTGALAGDAAADRPLTLKDADAINIGAYARGLLGVLQNSATEAPLVIEIHGDVHRLACLRCAWRDVVPNFAGLEIPDQGRIRFNGEEAHLRSVKDALGYGVGMVHQEFSIIDELTLAENLIIGVEPSRRGVIDRAQVKATCKRWSDRTGWDMPWDAPAAVVGTPVLQRLELIRQLETRLDTVILRLGFALTQRQARQLVSHGHVKVDGRRVDVPSAQVKAEQTIELSDKAKSFVYVREAIELSPDPPPYLYRNIEQFQGTMSRLPERGEIPLPVPVEERLIIEFYS